MSSSNQNWGEKWAKSFFRNNITYTQIQTILPVFFQT